jgi:hypothetical protein
LVNAYYKALVFRELKRTWTDDNSMYYRDYVSLEASNQSKPAINCNFGGSKKKIYNLKTTIAYD